MIKSIKSLHLMISCAHIIVSANQSTKKDVSQGYDQGETGGGPRTPEVAVVRTIRDRQIKWHDGSLKVAR